MKKIWLSMFYSIQVGEEPDSVFLKNRGRTKNTYKMRHYKKDNSNPTINYFIYEFHSNRNTCPIERICNLLSSCLTAKIYLRGKDDSFRST
ncbi:Uncharacterized protein ycf76 [Camellia lanceoleosa]|uniref:Uncharacterized protein ycf76 n=1 Tax=Camellia lanceoleosa TaxID=1840588 RepID=A0ACC0HG29_9ERIC|nr:Uncharacterized protein ycf76 [Camellia lanceoleosa]